MARSKTPTVAALERALELLEAIIEDGGQAALIENAARTGMPHATAHRMVLTMVETGYLRKLSRGRYIAGPRLEAISAIVTDENKTVALSRASLAKAAARHSCTAHLGVPRDNMVTYLAKEGSARESSFTREGGQLEAYCSALGKILLAHERPAERNAYFDSGPFVRITSATITDPEVLRAELDQIGKESVAWDREEIAENLVCCAAPVVWPNGEVKAAVSLSFDKANLKGKRMGEIARSTSDLAREIGRKIAAVD